MKGRKIRRASEWLNDSTVDSDEEPKYTPYRFIKPVANSNLIIGNLVRLSSMDWRYLRDSGRRIEDKRGPSNNRAMFEDFDYSELHDSFGRLIGGSVYTIPPNRFKERDLNETTAYLLREVGEIPLGIWRSRDNGESIRLPKLEYLIYKKREYGRSHSEVIRSYLDIYICPSEEILRNGCWITEGPLFCGGAVYAPHILKRE